MQREYKHEAPASESVGPSFIVVVQASSLSMGHRPILSIPLDNANPLSCRVPGYAWRQAGSLSYDDVPVAAVCRSRKDVVILRTAHGVCLLLPSPIANLARIHYIAGLFSAGKSGPASTLGQHFGRLQLN